MCAKAASIARKDEEKTREELLLELESLRANGSRPGLSGGGDICDETFRLLADASAAGILIIRGEDIVYVNQAMADLEGYTPEECRRMKFWETVHPDLRDEVRRRGMARQMGEMVPSRYEVKIVRKDGTERWVIFSSGLLLHEGRPAVLLVVQDITDLKHAEAAMKRSQYILAKAQEISHVGNWAWNLKTGRMSWSDEGFRIFGYQPGEVQPTFEWMISRVHPDDRGIIEGLADRISTGHKRCSVDYRIIKPNGSIRYINSVADKIVIGPCGMPERVYGINQDVTERKNAEEALKAAKTETELYVDLMGHDINNMNQITMGYLELAHNILEFEGKLGPDNIHLLDKAIGSLGNSSRLIDNVRKIQREKMGQYKPEILDIGKILDEVVAQFRNVPGRDVRIDYVTREESCRVKANALLKDVFINLVGNSIKHSTGPLEVRIRAERAVVDGRNYCRVAVEDDGPGIPDGLKRTLFDRLNLASTRARGKGFGICLIKMLVDDYNGKFWVEDRVEGDHTQGSRFVVLLPAPDTADGIPCRERLLRGR